MGRRSPVKKQPKRLLDDFDPYDIDCDSEKLGDNLEKEGYPRPGDDYQAHHIVPCGENRIWAKEAVEARRIFYKYLGKEHINDAVNGVWVRGGREHQSKLHNRRAYMLLFDRLKDVQSRSELIEELNRLRDDISNYRFP